MSAPRVVLATRKTVLQGVIERHGTAGQAEFFLRSRGWSLEDLRRNQAAQDAACQAVAAATPSDWRRAHVDRADFEQFLFEPEDIVVAVGQDGLVANLAKYLDGQPVIGINPSPKDFDGVLVPCAPEQARELLLAAEARRGTYELRTMVQASLDDGQELVALNEVFVGHRTHQSARYRIRAGSSEERQSSSGVIVATGTGATGWARSVHGMRHSRLRLPGPAEPRLVYFVREAFPSRATGTSIVEGEITGDDALVVRGEMDDGGVVFGDGIEDDCLEFRWGAELRVRRAARALCLLTAA